MKNKGGWLLVLFILCGLVLGGLIGNAASNIDFLWWLSYGEVFGLSTPIELDLSIIKLTFALMVNVNVASIIGMIGAIFIYRKI